MSTYYLTCSYCFKSKFLSERGLSQHVSRSPYCKAKQMAGLQCQDSGHMFAHDFMDMAAVSRGIKRNGVVIVDTNGASPFKRFVAERQEEMANGDLSEQKDQDMDLEDQDFGVGFNDWEEELSDEVPNRTILEDFKEYARKAEDNYLHFPRKERVAVGLLGMLRRTKASLGTYESVMEWHFRAGNKLRDHEILSNHPEYISRKVLFKQLFSRYNLTNKVNIVTEVTLPSSRARARIIKNDARAALQSLLTDPRITDDDYLFFGDDPLSPPPEDLDYIGDINTGLAYRESYAKLIKRPGKQVLLPVIFYMDGAATGQFADLPVTALKFTLGIFHRKARERNHMWRTLGYLPKISSNSSRGRRKFLESGHVDAMIQHHDMLEGEGNRAGTNEHPAQDMHTMMAVILEEFVTIQDEGFVWDLRYKGQTYEGIEFVPFVPFFKCDTEEADRLAGKYTARSGNVAQLCRYCCCPTQECDEPRAKYPRKTVPMIAQLVQDEDADGLKALSQQNISNSLYNLRFGSHNEEGVHGGCPLEMLHALQLGMFKYVRDCFFEQIGETSWLAQEINALAVEIGVLFARQSDRDLPKTKFSNGIQKGKLMAKEYTGVLLMIAAILRSSEGQQALRAQKSTRFAKEDGLIEDWIVLVETLLQWEEWLKSEQMATKDVRRAKEKHLYIMYLLRVVANRTKGMGLKIMKFHGIMHMVQDIINFGVPLNFDTGSDEANHKPSKTAAKVTQKRKETFDEQVCQRLAEVEVLDLASHEIANGGTKWSYLDTDSTCKVAEDVPKVASETHIGGSTFIVSDGAFCVIGVSIKAQQAMSVEAPFVAFVQGLTETVSPYIHEMEVRTTFTRNGVIFRGTPRYVGSVWRDWVVVDWGDDGKLPNKVWGFVDLSGIPDDNDLEYGGLSPIPPGIYGIVESATYLRSKEEVRRSEIFVPITKEVGKVVQGRVVDLKFYLADIDAFDEAIAVIPDIGGAANAYFVVKKRRQWGQDFVKWLHMPYEKVEDLKQTASDEDSSSEESC